MRVAFYAPLKAPDHPVPSGDRALARLFVAALTRAGETGGWSVEVASQFRSFDGAGDADRQERLRRIGTRIAGRLADAYRERPAARRPRLWFTYHLYHKAPDWLGTGGERAPRDPLRGGGGVPRAEAGAGGPGGSGTRRRRVPFDTRTRSWRSTATTFRAFVRSPAIRRGSRCFLPSWVPARCSRTKREKSEIRWRLREPPGRPRHAKRRPSSPEPPLRRARRVRPGRAARSHVDSRFPPASPGCSASR